MWLIHIKLPLLLEEPNHHITSADLAATEGVSPDHYKLSTFVMRSFHWELPFALVLGSWDMVSFHTNTHFLSFPECCRSILQADKPHQMSHLKGDLG
jgi:hypothetical protein